MSARRNSKWPWPEPFANDPRAASYEITLSTGCMIDAFVADVAMYGSAASVTMLMLVGVVRPGFGIACLLTFGAFKYAGRRWGWCERGVRIERSRTGSDVTAPERGSEVVSDIRLDVKGEHVLCTGRTIPDEAEQTE